MMADTSGKTNGSASSNNHVLGRPVYDPNAASAIEVEHIVKKYGEFTMSPEYQMPRDAPSERILKR